MGNRPRPDPCDLAALRFNEGIQIGLLLIRWIPGLKGRHSVALKECEGRAMLNAGGAFLAHWINRPKTMSEQPSKLACFMAELRRRHVFRVAVGYAAVAFVVLQLSEIVLPAFSAEWALQLVVVFVVLGFPVVMVLAWVFDITSEGIRVTDALGDDDRIDAPSTPNSWAISGMVLFVAAYRLTDVRETTRISGSWLRRSISASCMPAAK